MGSKLILNEAESRTFFDIIDSELRCCVNEYDPDTARCPSKKRLNNTMYARSIIEKWESTQPRITADFINLDKVIECELELTEKEAAYCRELAEKCVKEMRKELSLYSKPYTGLPKAFENMVVNAERIVNKL